MKMHAAIKLRGWHAIVAVACLSACAAIVGLDDGTPNSVTYVPPPPPPTPPDPCEHTRPPDPPTNVPFSERVLPVLLAASTDLLLAAPANGPNGFDLDNVCTCTDDPNTKFLGAASCRGAVQICDDPPPRTKPKGIDNALRAATGLFPFDFDKQLDYACFVRRGQGSVVYSLTDYNGERDDDKVQLSFTSPRQLIVPWMRTDGSGISNGGRPGSTSPFLGYLEACSRSRMPGDAGFDGSVDAADAGADAARDAPGVADAAAPTLCGDDAIGGPKFDGCDVWAVAPLTYNLFATSAALETVSIGYVRDGKLVVPYTGTRVITLGELQFTGTDGYVTADIELLDGRGAPLGFGSEKVREAQISTSDLGAQRDQYRSKVRLRLKNGVTAGRVEVSSIYGSFGQIPVVLPGQPGNKPLPLCATENGRAVLASYQKRICDGRDLSESSASDNKSTLAACTSFSFGITFSGEPAYIGLSGVGMTESSRKECPLVKFDGGTIPDSAFPSFQCP